jgi:GR25 family glycosyltransferase involved in LPS biosynthesis
VGSLDAVWVINLEKRTLRRDQMRFTLRTAGLLELTEFIPAIDGDATVTEAWLAEQGYALYPGWALPDHPNYWYGRAQTKNLIACTLMHLQLWRRIAEEGHHRVLILEDDVTCVEGYVEELERRMATLDHRDPDWDMLYGYRRPLAPDQGELDETIVIPGYCYSLASYVLTGTGAAKLVSLHLERCIIPNDEFVPATFIRHPRDDVAELYSGKVDLHVYATRPNLNHLVGHLSDTEASQDL